MAKPLITLSRHAKDRLCERHDKYLLRYQNEHEFNRSCYELLDRAEYTNRHKNDTAFMMFFQEKYGYEKRYSFKEWKNVLFVIVDDTCVTVLDTLIHRTSRQFGIKKKY